MDIADPDARMPRGLKFLPTTGATGKHTYWCGMSTILVRTSEIRRDLEKLCPEQVCVAFLVPKCFGPVDRLQMSGSKPGYNAYTWGLVVTYSVMGLLLAQVQRMLSLGIPPSLSSNSLVSPRALSGGVYTTCDIVAAPPPVPQHTFMIYTVQS